MHKSHGIFVGMSLEYFEKCYDVKIEYGKTGRVLKEYFRIHRVNRVQKRHKLDADRFVFGLILSRIFAFWCILPKAQRSTDIHNTSNCIN